MFVYSNRHKDWNNEGLPGLKVVGGIVLSGAMATRVHWETPVQRMSPYNFQSPFGKNHFNFPRLPTLWNRPTTFSSTTVARWQGIPRLERNWWQIKNNNNKNCVQTLADLAPLDIWMDWKTGHGIIEFFHDLAVRQSGRPNLGKTSMVNWPTVYAVPAGCQYSVMINDTASPPSRRPCLRLYVSKLKSKCRQTNCLTRDGCRWMSLDEDWFEAYFWLFRMSTISSN
jgi:hypothetical protein